MKNELGIEVCCANCGADTTFCGGWDKTHCEFEPNSKAYENRIKELQARLDYYEADSGGATVAELLAEYKAVRAERDKFKVFVEKIAAEDIEMIEDEREYAPIELTNYVHEAKTLLESETDK